MAASKKSIKTVTPSTFVWQGKDKNGNKVKGEAPGKTPALVKAQLRSEGINATSIKKKSKSLFGGKKPITPADIAIFLRQLATML
ncbi:MAG: type II secretion system F family protein, partial [Gammaproteobacteria bacterium]|nr:type II secretion system F family protein [Gammaproteobacteria bacterium]